MKIKSFSIKKKLFISLVTIATVPALISTIFVGNYYSKEFKENAEQNAKYAVETAQYLFEEKEKEALAVTKEFLDYKEAIDLFKEGDRNGFIQAVTPRFQQFMKEDGLTVFEIGDENGVVFARGHQPEKFGDDKSSNDAIQLALKGEVASGFEFGASGLAVRAFEPIKDGNKVIGTVQTGFSFNEQLLQEIKIATSGDVALYEGNKLVLTSDEAEKSEIGTILPESVIWEEIQQGKDYLQEVGNKLEYYYPLKDPTDQLIQGMVRISTDLSAVKNAEKSATIIIAVILIITVILGAFVATYMTNKIAKPITTMSEELQRVAKGDLSFEPTLYKTKDEVETLSRSFRDMVANISAIVREISKTEKKVMQESHLLSENSKKTLRSNQLVAADLSNVNEGAKDQLFQTKESAAAMDEISSQVIQIAKNSEVMKQSTSRTASSVQEMATSVEQISKSSQSAQELVQNAQKEAIKGKDSVNQARDEMVEISTIIGESAQVMKKLGKSSEEIGSIIEVIDSIAEQTNLLALNAAIEAARAGEHGKGFSVVADEVKTLAERSANATKEIATLIKGIQAETQKAVISIEQGNQKADEGTHLAQEASSAMEVIAKEIEKITNELVQINQATKEQAKESSSIVEDISKLEEQVNQVAKATQEQTIGLNEITHSIGKISGISQESSNKLHEVSEASKKDNASIQEIAQSAEELNELSRELQNIVQAFKLEE